MSDASAPVSIGVIGGSGLHTLFDDSHELVVDTPYGPTSGPITVGTIGGRRAAFLPRHGAGGVFAPHRIPNRANIWALAHLGATTLITSAAVGGLRDVFAPGMFVVPDQFIDRTTSRELTFYDEGRVEHLAAADPFDVTLRALAVEALASEGVRTRDFGTVVVIPGPRFATRAESRAYAAAGGDVINHTLVPETPLALELGLGVVNISFITDSDSAVATGHADAVTSDLVQRRLAAARPVFRRAIERVVKRIPDGFLSPTDIPADAIAEVLARPTR